MVHYPDEQVNVHKLIRDNDGNIVWTFDGVAVLKFNISDKSFYAFGVTDPNVDVAKTPDNKIIIFN